MEEYYYDVTVVFPSVITDGNFSLINAANTCSVVNLECANTPVVSMNCLTVHCNVRCKL